MVRQREKTPGRPGKAGSSESRRPGPRKKTLRLDQDLLDRARRALGARTETDAITQALEAVVRRDRQIQGLRMLTALGPIDSSQIE